MSRLTLEDVRRYRVNLAQHLGIFLVVGSTSHRTTNPR